MKLSMLMSGNAVLAFLFALGFLLAPGSMLSAYGATGDAQLVQMTRFFGAAMLGYALLTWFARNVVDAAARRAVLLSLFLSFAVGFIVAVQGQMSRVVNQFGWITVALYLFFTLGYGYFQLIQKEP